jgi:hypothetical protein
MRLVARRPVVRQLAAAVAGLLVVAGSTAPVLAIPVPEVSPGDGSTISDVPVLAWPAVDRALSYNVQVSANDAFTSTVYTKTVHANAATPEADLPPGTYAWRYQAKGIDGITGAWSQPLHFTMSPDRGPTLTGPADGAALTYPEAPVLAWEPVAGVKTYQVQWADNPGFTAARTVTTDNVSYVPTTLLPNDPRTTYSWRVRGVTTTATPSYTEYSEARQFTIAWSDAAAPVLRTPDDGAVVNEPRFSWDAVAGATRYELVVALDDAFTNPVETKALSGTSYVPSTTYAQQAHWWRVRALDANGTASGYSQPRSFTRAWLTPQGAEARPERVRVDGLTGSAATCGGLPCTSVVTPRNKVLLTWDPVVGASHYEVDVSVDPHFLSTEHEVCKVVRNWMSTAWVGSSVDTAALSDCNWVEPKVPGARWYLSTTETDTAYVRVRAVAASTSSSAPIYSAWSNITTTTPQPLLELVAAPIDESGGSGDVTSSAAEPIAPASGSTSADFPVLRWRAVRGASAYLVRIARDERFTNPALTALATDAQYYVTVGTSFVPPASFKDNTAGQAYYWHVLPCAYYSTWKDKDCTVGNEVALNAPQTYVRSFRKAAPAVEGGAHRPAGDELDGRWQELSWSELAVTSPQAAGVRSYQVEVTSGALDGSVDFTTDATAIVLSERAFTPGTQYKWRVRSVDGGGVTGPWSGEQSFVAPRAAGPSVEPVVGTAPTQRLQWTSQGGAKAYEVQVFSGVDPGFPDSALVHGGSAGAATSYVSAAIPDWLGKGDYSWRVRSVDHNGVRSTWSAMGTFALGGPAPVLEAPSDGASVARSDLRFAWRPVPQAVKYRVEVLSANGVEVVHRADVVGTQHVPPTSLPAGRYAWRISALIGDSATLVLSTSEVRALDLTSVPGTPTGARLTAQPELGALSLAWTAPETGGRPLTGYVVRYRADGGAWVEQEVDAATSAMTLGGLLPGRAYGAQVAAMNADGLGVWTREATATTATVPGIVSSLSVSASTASLRVSWRAPSSTGGAPVTGYRVEVRPQGTGDEAWVATEQGTATTSTVTSLDAGVSYEVRVAARNGIGLGQWSQYATAVRPNAPATTPPVPSSVVRVRAVSSGNKLLVDVDPNKGRGSWTFTVYKLRPDGVTWAKGKSYRTKGSKETRTLNLTKGTYRVVVHAKYGLASSTSGTATLRR